MFYDTDELRECVSWLMSKLLLVGRIGSFHNVCHPARVLWMREFKAGKKLKQFMPVEDCDGAQLSVSVSQVMAIGSGVHSCPGRAWHHSSSEAVT